MKNIFKKTRKAFTLIEMLIVVGILGILVSIAVPAISHSMSDSRAVKKDAYIALINSALQRYVVDQEVAGTLVDFEDEGSNLVTGDWAKIQPYMSVNGKTNASWSDLSNAICAVGKAATFTGGVVKWSGSHTSPSGVTTKVAVVTPVTAITCAE